MRKKHVKALSAAMVMSLMISGMAGCAANADSKEESKDDGRQVSADAKDSSSEKAVTDAITEGLKQNGVSVGKDETVYAFLDNSGAVSKVTVNDVIKNPESGSVDDVSDLKDINNVKGDETFDADGSKLTWKTDGENITYQGTSDKELPIDMKITYKLDGRKIEPDQLAGATGHIEIKYEYTNNTETTKDVDGVDKKVVVPFIAASGMMLPADKCTNITVDNGKVLEEGSNSIVVGYAVPGVMDCIKEQVNDENDILDKINVPESFTVEADVVDFEQDMCLTVVIPAALDKTEDSENINLDDITDKLDELSDGSEKLVDGSSDLDDGAGDLVDGASKIKDGTGELKDGTVTLKDGTAQLKDGAGKLVKGSGDLKKGVGDLNTGAKKLDAGAKSAVDGSSKIKDGLGTLSKGAADAEKGAKQLADGTGTLKSSSEQLKTGAKSASDGMTTLSNGISEIDKGMSALDTAVKSDNGLKKGAASLAAGAVTAEAGVNQLITTLKSTPDSVTAGIDKSIDAILEKVKPYGFDSSDKLAATITAIDAAIAENEAGVPVSTVLSGATGGKITSYKVYAQLVQANNSISTLEAAKAEIKSSMDAAITASADQIKQLQEGMASLKDGSAALSSGVNTLADSTGKLAAGTKSLVTGAATLKSGMTTLSDGADKLAAGAATLNTGAASLYKGNKSINSGAATLNAGMTTLDSGIGTLAGGITTLYKGTDKLYNGASTLNKGTSDLEKGIITLDKGAGKLKKGSTRLDNGVGDLYDGALTLKDGTAELKDGMLQFDEDGIEKITSLFGDDLSDAVSLVKAVFDEGRSYKNYSGISDDMDGTVKFIYKTEGISKDEE